MWLSPRDALSDNQAGRVGLAPPLVRILGNLAQYESLQAAFDAKPDLAPIEPVLWLEGKKRVILMPDDPDYGHGSPRNAGSPAPAAQATRLVHQDGVWLPYKA